jgi:hypothetical protein
MLLTLVVILSFCFLLFLLHVFLFFISYPPETNKGHPQMGWGKRVFCKNGVFVYVFAKIHPSLLSV